MSRKFMLPCLAAAMFLQAGAAAAQTKVTTIASSESLGHVPVYLAQAMGYFKQLGLDVENLPSNSGPRAIAAVLSGDVNINLGAPASFIVARQAGADIVMFAGTSTEYGASVSATKKWVDAHKLTPQMTYKEKLNFIKGATVGITSPGGGADQIFRYIAAEAGVNPDRDNTLVSLGDSGAQLGAFSQNRIDLLAVSAPTSHVAVRDFGGMLMFNALGGEVASLHGYLGSGMAAQGAWLKKNSATMTKFVRAMQMSLDIMHDPARTAEAREAVRKFRYPQIDAEFFAFMWTDLIASAPKTPEVTRDKVQMLIDFNNRFAKDKLPPTAGDGAYTNEFVEAALKEMR